MLIECVCELVHDFLDNKLSDVSINGMASVGALTIPTALTRRASQATHKDCTRFALREKGKTMFSIFKRKPPSQTESDLPVEQSARPAAAMNIGSPVLASKRRPANNYRQWVSDRVQKLVAGLLIWGFLAAWSLSAFWEHIETLAPSSKFMAQLGACGAEVILLWFILWHVYNKHMRVRFWALVFSAVLGVTILVHAGALRSMKGARAEQIDKEKRFAENAGRIAGESTKGAVEGLGRVFRNSDLSTRQKNNQIANAQNRGFRSAQSATKELKEIAEGADEKLKNSTWLPDWYVERHVYEGVFVIALTLFSLLMLIWISSGDDDVDENFDGVADRLQPHLFPPYAQPYLTPGPAQYWLTTPPQGGTLYSLDGGQTWIPASEPVLSKQAPDPLTQIPSQPAPTPTVKWQGGQTKEGPRGN